MTGTGEHEEPSRPDDGETVPDRVIERAREAFAQRAAGPIAHLVSDSLVDKGDAPDSHLLTFETDTVKIDLHVAAGRSLSDLDGTIHGLLASRALLHLEGSELALVAGVEGGSFRFDPVAHGLVRLSFDVADGPLLVTDWFQV